IEVQLSTANLRDYYSQKGGLLQGQYITISTLSGSAIGDVSGSVGSSDTNAVERHASGGSVDMTSQQDVIVSQGATVNFSGGGINYAAGAVNLTMLVSGNTVYNISTASANVDYDSIL